MTDAITQFILKPVGPLAAGVVLFGVVWGFFKGVESVLNDDTKLEIAVWLLGRKKIEPRVQPWPDTFTKVFDMVFGAKHLSWKCFWRSCVASVSVIVLVLIVGFGSQARALTHPFLIAELLAAIPFACLLPDFAALLTTRIILAQMRRVASSGGWFLWLAVDAALTLYVARISSAMLVPFGSIGDELYFHGRFRMEYWQDVLSIPARVDLFNPLETVHWLFNPMVTGAVDTSRLFLLPALFTSIWLWLYAGSGFLLKAARRFDIGFDWFNRKFDIEKKPLQSIGLVAGALVATVYWAAVIVGRVVG